MRADDDTGRTHGEGGRLGGRVMMGATPTEHARMSPDKEAAAEWVDVADLTPWADNPRDNEAAVAEVADSIKRFGFAAPIIARSENGEVIAGHTRLKAALSLGLERVPVRYLDLDPADAHLLALADNKLNERADWSDGLADVLRELEEGGALLDGLGWDSDELAAMLGTGTPDPSTAGGEAPDPPIPALAVDVDSVRGTVYELGRHRLICGDSTSAADLDLLMQGDVAAMVHADPPYGMGKESEGVTNDNLYGGNLDAFQLAWWTAWRAHFVDNGTAYVWGNAEDLWRLWFAHLDATEQEINVRNEVVWYKGVASAGGVGLEGQEGLRCFPASTERCLVIMLRKQAMGSLNAAEFPESFEPLRAYLDGEREAMGWGPQDTKRITGVGMHSHWFSRSQWGMPSAPNYAKLRAAADGKAFLRSFDDLRAEYEGTDRDDLESARGQFRSGRGYFDSTASPSSDVWKFDRVHGVERQGHPTPKPVAMVQRAILSSSKPGDIVAVPFGGSCPDLIACEHDGRTARIAELEPAWCDVIRKRWTRYAAEHDLDPGPGALDG